jgi:hypothetical protein
MSDIRFVKWKWRIFPCVICGSWLSKYWTKHRTCSWQCEEVYAQQAGFISLWRPESVLGVAGN